MDVSSWHVIQCSSYRGCISGVRSVCLCLFREQPELRYGSRNAICEESKALTEKPLGDKSEVVALGTYNVRLLCCAFGQVYRTVLSPSKVTLCVLKRYRTEALKLAHKHKVTGTPVLLDISDCVIPRKSLDEA